MADNLSSNFSYILLHLIVVFVLLDFLFLILSLVLFSVSHNSLPNCLKSHVAINIKRFKDSHLLCYLVRIDVFKLLKDLIFPSIRMNNLLNVETLDQILGDFIVGPNDNIINILASKDH